MRYATENRVHTTSTPVVVPQSELPELREKGRVHDVGGRPHLLIHESELRPIVVVKTARRPS
jgi:hypothetical protein